MPDTIRELLAIISRPTPSIMRIQVLLFSFFLFAISASCQSTASKVTIPFQQTFLLGEFSDFGYRAKLVNKGSETVTIQLRSKLDQSVISSLQLAPKQSQSLQVAADQLVAMVNTSENDALVAAKMSKKIYGMSYVGTNGVDIIGNESEMDGREKFNKTEPTSSDEITLAEDATPAQSKVKTTISSGKALVLGEGTSSNYSIDVSKLGGSLKVSIRDRRTNEQTQGFGLGNVGSETVNIRPYEVIYLVNTGSLPAAVTVDFSQPVGGARVVSEP